MLALQKLFSSQPKPPYPSPPSTNVSTSDKSKHVLEAPNSKHRGAVNFRSKMERNLRLMQQRKKPILQAHKVQRMIKAYIREEKQRRDVRCFKTTIAAFCSWLECEMEQRPLVAQAIACVERKRTLLLKHVLLAEKLNPRGKIRLSENDLKEITQI